MDAAAAELGRPAKPDPPPENDQRIGLPLATLLSALAGYVDAVGYLRLNHVFVSYMSGTTTIFAVAMGGGDAPLWHRAVEVLGLFVVGVVLGSLLGIAARRWHTPAVLAAVAALLAVAPAVPSDPVVPMVLAMGALNAAMEHAGPVHVSLTYVTGTLVKFGRGLAQLVARQTHGASWMAPSLPWIGLFAGAIAGGFAERGMGLAALWPGAGAAVILTSVAAVTVLRAGRRPAGTEAGR